MAKRKKTFYTYKFKSKINKMMSIYTQKKKRATRQFYLTIIAGGN
jgi:hypothetical protein